MSCNFCLCRQRREPAETRIPAFTILGIFLRLLTFFVFNLSSFFSFSGSCSWAQSEIFSPNRRLLMQKFRALEGPKNCAFKRTYGLVDEALGLL